MKLPSKPELIGSAIAAFLKSSGLGRQFSHPELHQKWREIAGDTISRHTMIRGFKNGVITVVVDSSAWLSELSSFRKAELISQLNEDLHSLYIRDIKFRVSRG